MKKLRKLLVVMLMALSIATFMPEISVQNAAIGAVTAEAATPKLNKTKLTLSSWRTYQLKLKNNKKPVKWSSSNKKIATVTSKGKVTARAKGRCTIRAKVGSKVYKFTLTVRKNEWNSGLTWDNLSYYWDTSYDVDVNLQKAYYSGGQLIVKAFITNNRESVSVKRISLSLVNQKTGTTIIPSRIFKMDPFLSYGKTGLYTFKYPKTTVRDLVSIGTITTRWGWSTTE